MLQSKFNIQNKYFISGINPDVRSGAGKFLQTLMKCHQADKYTFIYPPKSNSIRELYAKKLLIRILIEIFNRICSPCFFYYKVFIVSHKEIVIFHPQTIGYNLVSRILKNAISIKYYVLDNSYFCIKGYNEFKENECFDCLKEIGSIPNECESRKKIINEYSEYRQLMSKYSNKIEYLFQNELQKELLEKSNSKSDYRSSVIGMVPNDIFLESKTKITVKKFNELKDGFEKIITFHGADNSSKGSKFAHELAERLPAIKFIFPFKNNSTIKKNIYYYECNWESGLKIYVSLSDMVLVPSLWSAPVEGSLLKSIYYGQRIAVVNTKYGFFNEIPKDLITILPNNYDLASDMVYNTIYNKTNDYKHAAKRKEWIAEYCNNTNICNSLGSLMPDS